MAPLGRRTTENLRAPMLRDGEREGERSGCGCINNESGANLDDFFLFFFFFFTILNCAVSFR